MNYFLNNEILKLLFCRFVVIILKPTWDLEFNTSVMFCNTLIISALSFRAIARNLTDNQFVTIF